MDKSILLVEDEESLNRGISLKLTKEGYNVYSSETISKGYTLFNNNNIDLIICDIGLPDGDGLEFCRSIRRKSSVLFLFLTAMDTEIDIVNGYDAGADDYVTKPFSIMVLISKVNAMMKRTAIEETHLIKSNDITLYIDEKRVKKGNKILTLTPNEYKLINSFMTNPKCILSKRQLLDCLWDSDSDFADENTIAVNVRRLREKIEENPSIPVYIKNVRGMGYVWEMECKKE